MGASPNYAFPYPELVDTADANRDFKSLANAVDAALIGVAGSNYWVAPDASSLYTGRFAYSRRSALTDPAIGGRLAPDAASRWYIEAGGGMHWGNGAGSYPVNLYPSGTTLKTDNTFEAANITTPGTLTAGSFTFPTNLNISGFIAAGGALYAGSQVYVGSQNDAYLYRFTANRVGTFGSYVVSAGLANWGFEAYATGDGFPRAYLRNDGTLLFGDGAHTPDVNLYRSGGGVRTDAVFYAGGSILAGLGGGNLQIRNDTGKLYLGVSDDTWLARFAGGDFQTSGALVIGSGAGYGEYALTAYAGVKNPKIRQGSAIVSTDANGDASVGFSLAFPSTCSTVVLVNGDTITYGGWYGALKSWTTTGFIFRAYQNVGGVFANTTVKVNYLAFGY